MSVVKLLGDQFWRYDRQKDEWIALTTDPEGRWKIGDRLKVTPDLRSGKA